MNKPAEARLCALVAEWRETARIWDAQCEEYWPAAKTEMRPPDRQRSSVKNWVNWLNAMARDVEDALREGDCGTHETSQD